MLLIAFGESRQQHAMVALSTLFEHEYSVQLSVKMACGRSAMQKELWRRLLAPADGSWLHIFGWGLGFDWNGEKLSALSSQADPKLERHARPCSLLDY